MLSKRSKRSCMTSINILVISMGSVLSQPSEKVPQVYNSKNFQHTVDEINEISSQICRKTDLNLIVCLETLRLNYVSWKLSKIKAKLGLFPQKKQLLAQGQPSSRLAFSYLQSFQLTLNMKQVYKFYDTIKGFKQNSRNLSSERQTPLNPQTAEGGSRQSLEVNNNLCEICYAEQSDIALPCGHTFGPKCISLYIIQKEEKKCPMCRMMFLVGRSTMQRNLYTVIGDEDKCIYEGLRDDLLQVLKENNQREIRNALNCIAKNSKVNK